jgi:glyoxalase family protein
MQATPVIDRDYFLSVFFRQPQGILFEVATSSPGFTVDEALEHLGEELRLPKQHEHLRPALERILTPLTNPRQTVRS